MFVLLSKIESTAGAVIRSCTLGSQTESNEDMLLDQEFTRSEEILYLTFSLGII